MQELKKIEMQFFNEREQLFREIILKDIPITLHNVISNFQFSIYSTFHPISHSVAMKITPSYNTRSLAPHSPSPGLEGLSPHPVASGFCVFAAAREPNSF